MRAKKVETYNLPPINVTYRDDELRALATAIVLRAISDYEQILMDIENKKGNQNILNRDKKEIESFFNSEWCENLLSFAFKEDKTFEIGDIKAIVKKRIQEARNENQRLFKRRKLISG